MWDPLHSHACMRGKPARAQLSAAMLGVSCHQTLAVGAAGHATKTCLHARHPSDTLAWICYAHVGVSTLSSCTAAHACTGGRSVVLTHTFAHASGMLHFANGQHGMLHLCACMAVL